MTGLMKRYGGVALILFGAILLMVSYFTGLSHLNFVLHTGLFFIALGIILHVWLLKRQEKY
jgi:hypothetical protein